MPQYQIGNAIYQTDKELDDDTLQQLAGGGQSSTNTQSNQPSSMDSQQQSDSGQQNPESTQSQPNDSDNQNPFSSMPQMGGQQQQPEESLFQNNKSPLNFGDMMYLSAHEGDSISQQKFLQNKFKVVQPSPDGKSFMVGDDPSNLTPINAGNMGDAALRGLATLATNIPSIGGQIAGAAGGAAIGTMAEGGIPGPGTVIGGILGGGAGAGAGEAAKNSAVGYDPAKAKTDALISAAFGTGGEMLGRAIQFGTTNYLKPQVAAAMDAAIAKGGDIPASTRFIAKVSNFLAGVDQDEMMKAPQYGGFRAISANKAAWNKDYIDDVAKDVSQRAAQAEGIAGSALNSAEDSLYNSNPNAMVKTGDTLDSLISQLENKTVIQTSEGDGENFSRIFKFRDDLPSNLQQKDVEKFVTRLGAVNNKDGTFGIPVNAQIPLRDAVEAKKIWGRTFFNKNYDPDMGRLFKTALYGEEPSALYPKGFQGLRMGINDLAKATDNNAYVLANKNYSDLMGALNGEIKSGLNKFNAKNWMDVTNPASVGDYLSKYNKLDEFGRQAVENLKQAIGGDFDTKAGQYGVAQAINKAHPQLLRLSVITSLMSKLGLNLEGAVRLPLAFMTGEPAAIRTIANVGEGVSGVAKGGSKILSKLVQGASSQTGRAALSQLIKSGIGNPK